MFLLADISKNQPALCWLWWLQLELCYSSSNPPDTLPRSIAGQLLCGLNSSSWKHDWSRNLFYYCFSSTYVLHLLCSCLHTHQNTTLRRPEEKLFVYWLNRVRYSTNQRHDLRVLPMHLGVLGWFPLCSGRTQIDKTSSTFPWFLHKHTVYTTHHSWYKMAKHCASLRIAGLARTYKAQLKTTRWLPVDANGGCWLWHAVHVATSGQASPPSVR